MTYEVDQRWTWQKVLIWHIVHCPPLSYLFTGLSRYTSISDKTKEAEHLELKIFKQAVKIETYLQQNTYNTKVTNHTNCIFLYIHKCILKAALLWQYALAHSTSKSHSKYKKSSLK
jgi:hypothetical protein